MKTDLKDYKPQNPEYVIGDIAREEFPNELDFKGIEGIEQKRDAMKFIGAKFTAVFPENEYVERKMDEFEKKAIREEYNSLVETTIPQRKRELEEAVEEAKRLKKDAEERYASALQELAAYGAEVKHGITEERLKSSDSFCIALAGYYLTYTWNESTQTFILAKAREIVDKSDIFSADENNRNMMQELFGMEFPYDEPEDGGQDESFPDDNDDF